MDQGAGAVASLRRTASLATLAAVAAAVWAVAAADEELRFFWEVLTAPGGVPPDFVGPFTRELLLPAMWLPATIALTATLVAIVARRSLRHELDRPRPRRWETVPTSDVVEQVSRELRDRGPAGIGRLALWLSLPQAAVRGALRELDRRGQVDQDEPGIWRSLTIPPADRDGGGGSVDEASSPESATATGVMVNRPGMFERGHEDVT